MSRKSRRSRRQQKYRIRNGRGIKNAIWFYHHGPVAQVKCHWCPKMLTFNEATLDHEPPLSEGGSERSAVIACYECNQARAKECSRRANARKKHEWLRQNIKAIMGKEKFKE